MTTLQAEFEALMPEAATHRYRTFGHGPRWQLAGKHTPPDAEPLYTADQMRAMFDAATERAANIAQSKLDGDESGVQDDWTADGGWDWACMQIRNAIRGDDCAAAIRATGGEG